MAEDEPLIRFMVADALLDSGFQVIEVSYAEEALRVLADRAASIDMIFTDVHMPGTVNGLALASHASVHWPWISLLVTSGRALPGPNELPAGGRFLAKPYVAADVVRHASEMLAAA